MKEGDRYLEELALQDLAAKRRKADILMAFWQMLTWPEYRPEWWGWLDYFRRERN